MPREFIFMSEDSDLREWLPTKFGLAPKTRKRVKRARKVVTLSQAIAAAKKAGIDAGVISVGGVTLQFGSESHDEIKPNGHAIETADELKALI